MKKSLLLLGIMIIGLTGCQIDPQTIKDLEQLKVDKLKEAADLRAGLERQKLRTDDVKIVYVDIVDGKAQIVTIKSDGSERMQLTNDPGYKTRPTWSQDHDQIAFFHYKSDQPMDKFVSVTVMNADGSNARKVIKDKRIDTKKTRISWHTDASTIYVQEQDFPAILFGYNTTSGEQTETIRMPKNSFMTEVHTVSPDMRILAGAGPSKTDGIWHIGTIRRNGKKETDLMQPFMKVSYYLGTVVWSADSKLVAFKLDKVLMVMSSTIGVGFKAYPITPQDFDAELSGPAISPTTKSLACIMEKTQEGNFGSGDAEVNSNVWVMNIDGTKQRPITTSGACFDPDW